VRQEGPVRWLLRRRLVGMRVVKTALAAALAWALAVHLGRPEPFLAPLGAILCVQVTVQQTLVRGLQQAVAVVVAVVLGIGFSHLFGLHAWSLGLLIFLALLLGGLLRFGAQASTIATSALLVLALGGGYGWVRVEDTALGAGVGVAVNLAVAPPLYVRGAGEALAAVAEDAGRLLARMAEELQGEWDRERSLAWLTWARRLDDDLRAAREAVTRGEESLRFNPRGRGRREAIARQRQGLLALEHVVTQLRGVARAISDAVEEAQAHDRPPLRLHPLVRELLAQAGEGLSAFARLLADPTTVPADRERLRQALAAAGETRRRAFRELPRSGSDWHLYGSLFADLRRMLREIDPERGPHSLAVSSPATAP
jgi:uncharacterized membrane protein YgaE (UPF0421/DUF939 family)